MAGQISVSQSEDVRLPERKNAPQTVGPIERFDEEGVQANLRFKTQRAPCNIDSTAAFGKGINSPILLLFFQLSGNVKMTHGGIDSPPPPV